ncbi:MAG: hypothetical protein ACRECQ_05680, partial [Burkholderiaceae bacterium]
VLPHSAAEHRAILKAIGSGNADQAGAVMYDHVIESKQRALAGGAVKHPRARTAQTRVGKRARA